MKRYGRECPQGPKGGAQRPDSGPARPPRPLPRPALPRGLRLTPRAYCVAQALSLGDKDDFLFYAATVVTHGIALGSSAPRPA